MIHPDSLRIITVIAFCVFLGMGIRRPVYAAVSYMILDYCKISGYYPFFANMQAELVFAGIILVRIFFSSGSFAKLSSDYDPVNKYLLLFLASAFVSFLLSIDRQRSWDNGVYELIKSLVLCVMVLCSIRSESDMKIFAWSFLAMFVYLAYEPVFGFVTGTGADRQMYGDVYTSEMGVLSGHVALANNMNQCMPIAFFLIPGIRSKFLRSLGVLLLLILFSALVASKSRGGVVGFIVFAGSIAYFSKNRLRNAIVMGMLSILIFGFSGSLKSTGQRIHSGAIEGRLLGLVHGIEMVRVKGRVLGVGPGCYSFARRQYFHYRLMAHNIYGELIGDLGIPGTIAWFFLIRQIFINFMTSKRKLKELSMENHFLSRLATGLQVSLIVRLFISLASHGLYYFYWYVVAALSVLIVKLTEEISLDPSVSPEKISEMHALESNNKVPGVSL